MPRYSRTQGTRVGPGGGTTTERTNISAFGIRRHHYVHKRYDKVGNVSGKTETSGYGVTPGQLPSPPIPTGDPGVILVLGGTLLLVATWTKFTGPMINSLWTAQPFNPDVSWNMIIGGIVALVILMVIASMNADASNLITLMIIGAWIIYLVAPGQKNQPSVLTDLFNWFQEGTIHGAFGTFGKQSTGTTTSVPIPSAPYKGTPPTTNM